MKPAREDASVGICSASVVEDQRHWKKRVAHVLENYRQPVLVEEYIEGREIYVSILERLDDEPQVFPFFEIDFSDMPADRPNIVSFEGKWVEDSIEYKGTRPVRCEKHTARPARHGRARRRSTPFAPSACATTPGWTFGFRPTGFRTSLTSIPTAICRIWPAATPAAKAAGLSYRELILRIVGAGVGEAVTGDQHDETRHHGGWWGRRGRHGRLALQRTGARPAGWCLFGLSVLRPFRS